MVEPTAADDGVYIPGDGDYAVEAVGAPAFQETLEFLARGRTEQPTDYVCTAVLLPEPDNPDDPEAVAVTILGEVVGYLPADAAERMQVAMGQWGFAHATCQALIGGGWYRNKDDKGDFRVWLDVNPDFAPGPFPIAEEAEYAAETTADEYAAEASALEAEYVADAAAEQSGYVPKADAAELEQREETRREFLAPAVMPTAAAAEKITISLREVSIAAAAAVAIGLMFSIAWLTAPSASTDNSRIASQVSRNRPAPETAISSEDRLRAEMASIAETKLEPAPAAIYAGTDRGPVIDALAPDATIRAPLASVEAKAETPLAAVPVVPIVVKVETPQNSNSIVPREFKAVPAPAAVVAAAMEAKSLPDHTVIIAAVTRAAIVVVPLTSAGLPSGSVLRADAEPDRAISSLQPDPKAVVNVPSTINAVTGSEIVPTTSPQVTVGDKAASSPGPSSLPEAVSPRHSPVFTDRPSHPPARLHPPQRVDVVVHSRSMSTRPLELSHPRSRHWRPAPDTRWRRPIVRREYEQRYVAPVANAPMQRPLRPGETMASRLIDDGMREWFDKGLPRALGQPMPAR